MKVFARIGVGICMLLTMLACASGRIGDPMGARVASLVDGIAKTENSQERALRELERMGDPAVPYLVSHLDDMRPVASQKIMLMNKSDQSFEAFRHYKPQAVHDIVSAVLNQITGESFEAVYNGGSDLQRQKNIREWTAWCRLSYPSQVDLCGSSDRRHSPR